MPRLHGCVRIVKETLPQSTWSGRILARDWHRVEKRVKAGWAKPQSGFCAMGTVSKILMGWGREGNDAKGRFLSLLVASQCSCCVCWIKLCALYHCCKLYAPKTAINSLIITPLGKSAPCDPAAACCHFERPRRIKKAAGSRRLQKTDVKNPRKAWSCCWSIIERGNDESLDRVEIIFL